MLNVKKIDGNIIKLHYRSNITYTAVADYLNKKHDEHLTELVKEGKLSFDDNLNKYDKKILIPAIQDTYFQKLDYKLSKLILHLKSLLAIYKDYLVFDYAFEGVFLKDNGKTLAHCDFYSEDEEYGSFKILGKSFKDFYNTLKKQMKLGEIKVCRVNIELFPKKIRTKRKRTHIPRGLRKEVFKRDNYTCKECGAKKSEGATLHIDHIIPISKGGTDELDNLQTLCSDCNLNKSNIIQ